MDATVTQLEMRHLHQFTWVKEPGTFDFHHNSVHSAGVAVLAMQQGTELDPLVPCLVRTLGCADEGRQMPPQKKHELLIPFPDAQSFEVATNRNPVETDYLVPLPDHVVERFHRLSDELSGQWRGPDSGEGIRPYEPVNTRPNRPANEESRALRLRPGDLVYFSLRQHVGRTEVKEISFSSIWRGEVPLHESESGATAHDFFTQIDANLVPLTSRRLCHPEARLTPAELLFGCVESREALDGQEVPLRTVSMRGRVSSTFGLLENHPPNPDDLLLHDVILKVLSSPKPPSPSMYFHRQEPYANVAIRKQELRAQNPGLGVNRHLPNGRKAYMLRDLTDPDGGAHPPWRSHPAVTEELLASAGDNTTCADRLSFLFRASF